MSPFSPTRGSSFRSHPRRHPRCGQALVEAALIMPILSLFLLSIVQFGLVSHAKLAIGHACREGARFAAVHAREKPTGNPSATADQRIVAEVQRVAKNMGVGLLSSDIAVGPSAPNTSTAPNNRPLYDPIIVTVSYDMNRRRIIPRTFYFPIGGVKVILPVFDGNYTLAETAVMEGAN